MLRPFVFRIARKQSDSLRLIEPACSTICVYAQAESSAAAIDEHALLAGADPLQGAPARHTGPCEAGCVSEGRASGRHAPDPAREEEVIRLERAALWSAAPQRRSRCPYSSKKNRQHKLPYSRAGTSAAAAVLASPTWTIPSPFTPPSAG